jgi:hypothetical protein
MKEEHECAKGVDVVAHRRSGLHEEARSDVNSDSRQIPSLARRAQAYRLVLHPPFRWGCE